jgi:hypothetical protein
VGTALVFRLRTPRTGTNGYPFEMTVPGVFARGQIRDILVSYDGAVLSVAVAGTGQAAHLRLTPAVAAASLFARLSGSQATTDELWAFEMLYLVACFAPTAVVIGLLGRTRRERLSCGAVCVVAWATLLEVVLVLASGKPFDWSEVTLHGGVGAVVVAVALWALSGNEPAPDRAPLAWRAEAGWTS